MYVQGICLHCCLILSHYFPPSYKILVVSLSHEGGIPTAPMRVVVGCDSRHESACGLLACRRVTIRSPSTLEGHHWAFYYVRGMQRGLLSPTKVHTGGLQQIKQRVAIKSHITHEGCHGVDSHARGTMWVSLSHMGSHGTHVVDGRSTSNSMQEGGVSYHA